MDGCPENKRIKFEHSYARESGRVGIKVEDPLKISADDLDYIKKEADELQSITEAVEVKKEPGLLEEEQACCSGVKCENDHDEKSLMDLVGSEPCESAESEYFFANLGLVNCDGEAANGSTANPDFVPKVVFQEMQKMYEKAMADVKSLTKKLSTERQRKTTQSIRNANNTKTLKNDIKKLKDQLKVSQESLNRRLGSRMHAELELKNTITTLRKQIDKLMAQNKNYHVHLSSLKQAVRSKDITIRTLQHTLEQRSKILHLKKKEESALARLKQMYDTKEMQYKDLEKKCAHLSQNLIKTTSTLNTQLSELEKLKLDMDIMDRSIIDSVKTRHSLSDQLTVIEKEFTELKMNPALSLKLQEVQTSLINANTRLDVVQKQLECEKNNVAVLLKEKLQQTKEYNAATNGLNNQVSVLKMTVAPLRKTCKQKTEQYLAVVAERDTCREELERRNREIESIKTDLQRKLDEALTKQCQYCGF